MAILQFQFETNNLMLSMAVMSDSLFFHLGMGLFQTNTRSSFSSYFSMFKIIAYRLRLHYVDSNHVQFPNAHMTLYVLYHI